MKFIVMFLLLFTSVFADRDGGPYLGIGYGNAKFNDDGFYQEVKEKKSDSIILYAGAYINKYLSVEFNYIQFDAFSKDNGYIFVDETAQEKRLELDIRSISTLAHYAFLDDSLDFYARFGAGEIRNNIVSKEGFTMLYGVGMSYRLGKMFSLKIAYDLYEFELDKDDDNSGDYEMKLDFIYTGLEIQF